MNFYKIYVKIPYESKGTWVRGLYKPALSDAKASLSGGFGAFRIVIILTYGRGAVSNTTGATRKRGVNDKATVNTPDRQSPWRFNLLSIKECFMRKTAICVIASLFPLMSIAEPVDIATYDVLPVFEGCTVLETNSDHAIYQCPSDIQWIIDMKQNEPNGMFQSNFDSDENVFNLVLNDTEHEYVEVAFADAEMCDANQTAVRIKIAQPSDELWAFVGCK